MKAYLALVSCVVVEINDAACTSRETGLNKSVVFGKVRLVDVARRCVVREELPSDGKTEDVESVVVHEVLHLTEAIGTVILSQRWPCSACRAVAVGVATEIETCDVDTSEL